MCDNDIYPTGAAVYFGIFVVSRVTHTLCYLKPLQPYRTISYFVGVLVCLTLCGHIVYAVAAG